jgi:putative SOS response-associated peptidase YedK
MAGVARRGIGRRGRIKIAAGPYPADDMICWPVSPRVGSVKNNDPSLIEPVAAAG